MDRSARVRRIAAVIIALLGLAAPLGAQPPASAPPSESQPAPNVNLTQEQQAILRDYQGFEKRLAELAEALRSSDIDRANLLLEARSESQRQQVQSRLDEIVAILSEKRPFADAVERQKLVVEHMEAILKILQTDAERDRLRARIKDLEETLKEANRIIAAQKDVRADTERGGEFGDLEGAEGRVGDSARKLAEKIDRDDARRMAENQPESQSPPDESPESPESPPNGEPQSPENADSPQSRPQPSQGQPSQGQPSKGQPSQGQPSQGDQSQAPQSEPQGQQGEQQQDADRTPGREELEQARKEMEQAIQELKAKNRDDASNEQDEAIANLEAMKARIEEILRQLRQEEKEQYLTMLEARFQEMLKLQLRINAETVRLDARDVQSRGEAHFTKSRDLGRQEQQNVLAAEKALSLLHEEGSSVAFPEAVEQMRSNMDAVATRLSKGDTGETSQLIEKLIVESLEEMILSLQKELEKLKQEQQRPPGQQGPPQDPRLVDVLAELKMIRSLQNQVNRLTKQIGLQIEGEQAQDPDALNLLRDLSRRQERIQEATYDLSTGRNQ